MEILMVLGLVFSGYWVVEEVTAKPQCYFQVTEKGETVGTWRDCTEKDLKVLKSDIKES